MFDLNLSDKRLIEVKREIARILKVSMDELEEMLQKIKQEAPQLITDRIALLILMERKKIINQEILSKLLSEYAILRISDLQRGMRGINIFGRITRILKPIKGKQIDKVSVIIDDGTGRALISFEGRTANIFRKVGFDKGDLILIKNAYVSGFIREIPVVIADEKAEISYLDETDLPITLGISQVPYLPPPLSVSEFIKVAEEIVKEGKEFDLRGVLIAKYNEIKIRRRDGKVLRKRTYKFADELNEDDTIIVVAWDSAIDRMDKFHLGDILLLQGCVAVKSVSPSGGERIDIFIGNLSDIEKIGVKRKKISELIPKEKALIFGFNLSKPKIKEYHTEEGVTKKFLYTTIADETGIIRLVVWDENLVSKLENLKYADKLRVFGTVRESKLKTMGLEIHVSKGDEVILDPEDFPEISLNQIETLVMKKRIETKIIDDFDRLEWGKKYDIKAFLIDVKKTEREGSQLSGIIIIRDRKGKELKVMIWQNDMLFEKLEKVPKGSLILIKNIRTPKEDRGEGLTVLFGGEKTDIEIIELSEGKEEVLQDVILLREAKEESYEKVLGTIIDVTGYGFRTFCSVCNAPIIEKVNNKYICEFGHETEGRKELTLTLLMDDDLRSAEVFIRENVLRELNLFYEELSEKVISKLKMELIGKEVIIEGEIKPAPATIGVDYRILADRVIFPSSTELLKIIKMKLSKYGENDEG